MSESHSFLKPSNIVLHVDAALCLSTDMLLLPHKWTTLAVVNNTAVNMGVQVLI